MRLEDQDYDVGELTGYIFDDQKGIAVWGSYDMELGSHLDTVPDGAGCAEIWEHISDSRTAEND